MKKFLLFVLGTIFAFACSSDDDSASNHPKKEKETPDTARFVILENPYSYKKTIPRMVFSYKGWSGCEIVDEQTPEALTLLFFNPDRTEVTSVTATSNSIVFAKKSPSENSIENNIYVVSKNGNRMRESVLEMDWETMQYTVLKTTSREIASSSSKHKSAGYYDDYDDIRETFFNFYNNLSTEISKLSDFIPGESGRLVCNVWTKLAIPVAKYALYSDDPEKINEIRNEIMEEETESFLTDVILTGTPRVIYNYYKKASSLVGIIKRSEEPIDETELEYFEDEICYVKKYSNAARITSYTHYNTPDKYEVRAGVGNVTKNTADAWMSISFLDGNASFISDRGFKYGKVGGGSSTMSTGDDRIVLNNLEEGTQYWLSAYVRSFGTEYESSRVYFTTEATFAVYPEEITFNAKGGSRGISITLPNKDWTWEISNKPSWCSITGKSKTSFFVDAKESKKERSGKITITATNGNGTSLSKTIKVVQSDNNWNGTKWNFTGNISSEGVSSTIKFGIDIKNVEKNEFSCDGDLSDTTGMSISCDNEGRLIIKQEINVTNKYGYVKGNVKIVITKTTETAAKGNISGHVDSNLGGVREIFNFTGNITGKRITQ